MRKERFMLACLLGLCLSGFARASDTGAWMLSYENMSSNPVIFDRRWAPLLHTHLPAALSNEVEKRFQGPPDPVIVASHRYVSASACIVHDCGDKGFFWIDTQTGASLGATVGVGGLRLGSNSLRLDAMPAPARAALLDWISYHDIREQEVAFIGADNVAVPLAAVEFQPRPRFQPPPSGPGFDCAAARTAIETTICGDPELSQIDLAMQRRFDEGQHGVGTVPNQNERRALQRRWLAERDRTCGEASDRVACLKDSYAVQTDRLDHWVPAK